MNRTNVILLSIDTLRADNLSCYGCRRKTSPNIDRIAAQGLLFENAYSVTPWTPATHASMVTGFSATQHCLVDDNRLSAQIPTLAVVLRDNGYRTAGFVNNRQVGAPNRRVLEWLRTHQDDVEPFYLFVHYTEGHYKLRPPQPIRSRYLIRESLRDAETNRWQALYDEEVAFLDFRVGQVIDETRSAGLLDNTLLIVTTDHGEYIGGEDGFYPDAASLDESITHTPLILRYPRRVAAGRREPDIVQVTDIFPTVLEVTGAHCDGVDNLSGNSLLHRKKYDLLRPTRSDRL